MKKTTLYITLLFGTLISIAAMRYDDPVAVLLERLKVYTDNNYQEKVHIHLDKPYYTVGDDIWFKAYVLDASTGRVSDSSNVLYVELISEPNVIRRLNLPMENGITWGDFKLPDSLQEGNYRIRAYTQWMRNAGSAFYFDKTIRIGNAWSSNVFTKTTYAYKSDGDKQKVTGTIVFKDSVGQPFKDKDVSFQLQLNGKLGEKGKTVTDENGQVAVDFDSQARQTGNIIATITVDKKKITKSIPITAASEGTDVQFMPEGGQLVSGLPGRVAFKALNASGNGEDISGKVVNSSGAEIVSFSSAWLGMGSFFFTPVAGEQYSARVKFKDGSEHTFALPVPQPQGYVISVGTNVPEKLAVKIFVTPELQNKGELTLVGQHGGVVYFVSKIPSGKQLATVNVPTAKLPAGILQFTLFSPAAQPLCERIVFINNTTNNITLETEGMKPVYAARENAVIKISANSGKPVQGSFSVAVTNASVVKPDADNESNIFTSLLLTSDISGYVERPNHYFLHNDARTREELDVLLLTQGWRKIDWNQLGNVKNPDFQIEKSLRISGRILNKGVPVPKAKITLAGAGGGVFLVNTTSDENGKFSFEDLVFPDSTKFLIQARTAKDKKNVKIEIDQLPGQVMSTNRNGPDIEVNVNESMSDYIRQSKRFFEEQVQKGLMSGIQIKEITVKADRMEQQRALAPNSVNLNGKGAADYVIGESELSKAITIKSILYRNVPGIMFVGPTADTEKAVLSKRGGYLTFQIRIDGNIAEQSELMFMDPRDLESIEVITSLNYGAIYRNDAVILLTTRRGPPKYEAVKYAPGVTTYAASGYSHSRTFYSPKYDLANNDMRPDLRTTVYWNPHVTTDADGKGTFDFYNTDQAGNYRIVIEGIDLDGRIGRKVIEYKVGDKNSK